MLERGSEALRAAQEAFVAGMQATTLIAGGVMVIAAIVALVFIPNRKEAAAVEH